MMVYFAMGGAGEDRTSRMAQAMINSSSVMPASAEHGGFPMGCLGIRPWYEALRNIARTILLLLDLQRRLAADQRYRPLLRILRIHLHDGQVRCARRQRLNDDSHQRSTPAYSLRVRPARR